MRFQITLQRTSKQRMIPMDYQYYISAWIYKVLKQANIEFASFLHEKGYGNSDTKLYKLFCFSRLNFGKPILWKEKKLFEITRQEIKLTLSFDVDEVASNFIKGLFLSQEFYLGDKFNGIDFKVSNVAAVAPPQFQPTMSYRLQSPWVVSFLPDNEKHPRYLRADEDQFEDRAIKHILEKYKSTRNKNIPTTPVQLQRTSDFKRSGFVIKPHTPQQTRVVGNLFDFELTAPAEIHEMVWNAGISEKSASGFGWLEVVN